MLRVGVLGVCWLLAAAPWATGAAAEAVAPESEEPASGDAAAPAEDGNPPESATPADAASGETPAQDAEAREDTSALPRIDVYLPEGELDLRLSRLIKNAYFEGQIKYDFVGGDISAFLRYRYYGYRTIYQVGAFDAVEFENVEEFDNDFERVRGLLTLLEWPLDYHHRTFLLAELDRLSSNKEELQFSNNRTNTFVRFGYQRGTPDDDRSNALIGETRARIERLFSAHRKIGPAQWGFTGALTYSFDFLGADFNYLRAEATALKRRDLPGDSFVIGRIRAGTFLDKDQLRGDDVVASDRYSIPRSELFSLGGRENLKGVSSKVLGSEVLQATAELFVPFFQNQPHRFLGLDWETLYGVFYAGVGTTGFDRDIFSDSSTYTSDIGIGFEAKLRLKDYQFFLSGIVAQELDSGRSPKTHFTLRSYH